MWHLVVAVSPGRKAGSGLKPVSRGESTTSANVSPGRKAGSGLKLGWRHHLGQRGGGFSRPKSRERIETYCAAFCVIGVGRFLPAEKPGAD